MFENVVLGLIIVGTLIARYYIYVEKSKFVKLMNNPGTIQSMQSVPFWLKFRVWSQYGRYVGKHVSERELEQRERYVHINWTLEAMKYGLKNSDEKTLRQVQEYNDNLTRTYRMIWLKMNENKERLNGC